jgi:CBS domain-containing protein
MAMIGDICLRDVDVVDAGEAAFEAARRMRERNVGTLLVVNESRHPVGLVTDRDLTVRVLGELLDPRTTTVGAVMTRDPTTVPEDTAVEEALALMKAGGFRRLPVVDRAGRLVGVVSLTDVLALSAEELALIGKVLERERPHRVR